MNCILPRVSLFPPLSSYTHRIHLNVSDCALDLFLLVWCIAFRDELCITSGLPVPPPLLVHTHDSISIYQTVRSGVPYWYDILHFVMYCSSPRVFQFPPLSSYTHVIPSRCIRLCAWVFPTGIMYCISWCIVYCSGCNKGARVSPIAAPLPVYVYNVSDCAIKFSPPM